MSNTKNVFLLLFNNCVESAALTMIGLPLLNEFDFSDLISQPVDGLNTLVLVNPLVAVERSNRNADSVCRFSAAVPGVSTRCRRQVCHTRP